MKGYCYSHIKEDIKHAVPLSVCHHLLKIVHITQSLFFNCKFKDLFERKPNQIPSLSIRVQPHLRTVGFVKRNALIYSIPVTPPWLLK